MADSDIPLNPVSPGGQNLDSELLAGQGPAGVDIQRERVQVTGAQLAQIAIVNNLLARLADMGLTVRVAGSRAETAAETTVNQNVASVTILAANLAGRIGFSVFNNSSANLYLAMGPVAALAAFAVELVAGAYYETPFGYAGQVTGIWDAAGGGNAQVVEYT